MKPPSRGRIRITHIDWSSRSRPIGLIVCVVCVCVCGVCVCVCVRHFPTPLNDAVVTRIAAGLLFCGVVVTTLVANLQPATGATLWSFTTQGLIQGSPAVHNGLVYIASQDGNLYALAASSGSKYVACAVEGSRFVACCCRDKGCSNGASGFSLRLPRARVTHSAREL